MAVQHPTGAGRQLQLSDHHGPNVTGGPATPRQPRSCPAARAGTRLGEQPVRAALHVRGSVTGNRNRESVVVCAQLYESSVRTGRQRQRARHGAGGSTNPGSPGRTSLSPGLPSAGGGLSSTSSRCRGLPQPRSSKAVAAATRALPGEPGSAITDRRASTASSVASRHTSPSVRPSASTTDPRFREPAGLPAPGLRPPLGTNHPEPALISFDIQSLGHR